MGRKTNQHSLCKAYTEKFEDGVVFKSYKNPLSNYFQCELQYEDNIFHSSEQLYQFLKCNIAAKHLTIAVLNTKTAAESKKVTSRISDECNLI